MAKQAGRFDLTEALQNQYPEMSSGQRRIADCLVQHQDEAQFFTGAQLGARVGLSESAVVRFAQFMGFGGYPDLRRAIRQDFRARATNTNLLFSSRAAFTNQSDLIREIAHSDATLVQETASGLDAEVLSDCAAAILAADRVFVAGHRTSHALAEYLALTLRQGIGTGEPISFGTGMVYDILAAAKPADVVIAVAITPYAQQTIDIMCAAKARGLRCIAITDHPLGAPARIADAAILFETALHVFTSSYVGVMTIAHILLAMVGNQAGERVEAVLARADPLNAAFRTRHEQDEESPCAAITDLDGPVTSHQ